MIVVVADTSPLNYLVQIDCQELLAALYAHILVPPAVMSELHHPRTPLAVRAWLEHLPAWVEIRAVQSPPPTTLAGLDPGEREAIQLAQEQHADLPLSTQIRMCPVQVTDDAAPCRRGSDRGAERHVPTTLGPC